MDLCDGSHDELLDEWISADVGGSKLRLPINLSVTKPTHFV